MKPENDLAIQQANTLSSTPSRQNPVSELEHRLDLAIMCLKMFDSQYHALGADVSLPGWGITLQALIRHLELGEPLPETCRVVLNPK